MIYRRLDSNDDYSFGQGRQNFLSGVEAVAQAIKTRLFLLYGEWWEDLTDGLPLWQSIIGVPGGPNNRKAVDLLIKERINGTPNVTAITNFSSSFNSQTRSYVFQCTVDTAFGAVTVTNANGQLTSQGVG